MSKFNRDQFKATSTKALKKLKEEEDKMLETRSKTDEIEIKDGLNKIRIAPKFPHEKDFYFMEKRTWIPFEKEDGETVRIPVLDSIVHGGTEMDIIQEYVKFAKEKLNPEDEDDAKKLSIITDWKKGLVPQFVWKAYAWKLVKGMEPEFGIFSFKRTVRDELLSLSIIEDDDEAIEIDPFTDPDEGLPILLTYNSKAKKASDYYKVTLSKNAFAMTDKMFKELISKKPLSEIMRNNYAIEDFEKALDGVKLFDAEHEIDLVDQEEFEELVAKVRAQYTKSDSKKKKKKATEEDDEEEEVPKKSKVKAKAKAKVEEEEDDDEDDDDVEEEKPKGIDFKKKLKAKKAAEEVEEDDEDSDDEEEEEPKPKKKAKKVKEPESDDDDEDDDQEEEKPKKGSSSSGIDKLRERLAAAKKKGK